MSEQIFWGEDGNDCGHSETSESRKGITLRHMREGFYIFLSYL